MKKNILYPIARIMHFRLSRKYEIQIPTTTQIGYGLLYWAWGRYHY